VFYFPYLSFPITDERQSGFLFPRQGYSSDSGFDLAIPYYWNIAPNRDMTLTPRLMSRRGVLLGAEYRFLDTWQQGQIKLEYFPDDRLYGDSRGSFNVINRAEPLPNIFTDLRYEYVSDNNYLRDLSNNLDFLTPNYLERHLDARYYGAGAGAGAGLPDSQSSAVFHHRQSISTTAATAIQRRLAIGRQ
jgi:LPS-assembly protein